MILIDEWRARKRKNPEDLRAWVCYNFHIQYFLAINNRKGISYPVYKAIKKKGYQVPTPIQRRFAIAHTCSSSKLTYLPIRCIPLIMDGKDVVAMARTGLLDSATCSMFMPLQARARQLPSLFPCWSASRLTVQKCAILPHVVELVLPFGQTITRFIFIS